MIRGRSLNCPRVGISWLGAEWDHFDSNRATTLRDIDSSPRDTGQRRGHRLANEALSDVAIDLLM